MNHTLLLSSAIVFLVGLIGALPFIIISFPHRKSFIISIEAFVVGIFLAISLLHMLPESIEIFSKYSIPWPGLIVGAVILLFLYLEHFTDHYKVERSIMLYMLPIILCIHSIAEGLALGINIGNIWIFPILLLAVLSHKIIIAGTLIFELKKHCRSQITIIIVMCVFILTAPIGMFVGAIVASQSAHYQITDGIFLAIAAGSFLYLGTLHGLKRVVMVDQCCNIRQFFFVILGFIIIALPEVTVQLLR